MRACRTTSLVCDRPGTAVGNPAAVGARCCLGWGPSHFHDVSPGFWGEKENELGIYGKIICSSLLEDRVERFQDGLSMMFSPHLPEFFFGIL